MKTGIMLLTINMRMTKESESAKKENLKSQRKIRWRIDKTMNEVQENVILMLYAEAVEYSPYPNNRDDKIVELWNYFSKAIPDWQERFRCILEERYYGN